MGIEVDVSPSAERVVRSLNRIIEWRGKPLAIRAGKQGIALTCIQPFVR